MDTDAVQEVHDEFAFPGMLIRKEQTGTHPESGRPQYDTTKTAISMRVEVTNQPSQVVNPDGDTVESDLTIRLSVAELNAADVYPAPDDVIQDDRPEPVGGDRYEILRVVDRQSGILECDCVRYTDES